MADITMPQLGETVTEGTITKWFKNVGDAVAEDENLYEVSTDKVDSEVPSPVAGYLAEILVQEGETVEVGARVAVISDAPPAGGEAEPSAGAGEAPAPAAAAEPEPEAQPAPEPAGEAVPEPEPSDEPAEAAAKAEQAGASEATATAVAAPPAPPRSGDGAEGGADGKVLSPVVRRLIAEHGLNPADIKGTGTGGRITRADVLAYIDTKQGAAPPPSPAPAPVPAPVAEEAPGPAAPARPAATGPAEQAAGRPAPAAPAEAVVGRNDEVVAFSNIRRRTAEHMRRSLDTSAHTLVTIEVDYENVERARLPAKDAFRQEEGVSLSYLPFIARAVIDAIREFPHVNASVGDDALIVHRYVNLGVAVDLNFQGLIVPVVQDADGKRLRALAREIADLATRARAKKLSADEIAGGTFTITNAGGYGTLITGPIINQPQVAILSTDGVKPKPVAVPLPDGDYGIAVHPVGALALSFDHRAYDGAYAAAFLAKIKDILETRDWVQELG